MESEIRNYKIMKYLGGGGFGDVYCVLHTNRPGHVLRAMKKIRCNSEINENQKKELLKEAEILKKIDSEFIVSYYESFIHKGIPYLIMDYYDNGDLNEFIFKKNFNGGDKRKKIFTIFTKILLGLYELHKQHIAHRDIKPLNILMADDLSPKIGDLGLSKILGSTNSTMNTLAGTLMFQAPEMFNDNPSYTLKTDIWALGITLYMMFLGTKPYPENNPGQLIFLIMKGKYNPIPYGSDPDLKKLTEKILCVNPLNRPSAENILDDPNLVKNLKIYGLLDLVTKTKNKDLYNNHIVNNINNQTVLCGLQILARCSSFVQKLQCFYDVKFPFTHLLNDTFLKLLNEKNYDPSPFIKKFCEMNHVNCSQNFIRTVLNDVNNEIICNNGIIPQRNILLSYNDYSPIEEKEKNSYNLYLKQNNILPESKAVSVFSGILKSHLKGSCTTCGNYIDNYFFCYFIDQNMYLDSIFRPCYFEDVIKQNLSSSDITMNCEKCGRSMKINENKKIVKLPEILIFTLERYINGTNNLNITPNEIIDLKPYVDMNLKCDTIRYELFAKNIRLGSTKKHEICQIIMDGSWYEFNDKQISRLHRHGCDDCTYSLFYKKKK